MYKSTTENRPFLNRDRIFTINNRVKLDNGIYYYWLKEYDRKVKGRFAREELSELSDHFS